MVIEENERLIKHIKSIGYLKSKNIENALREVQREFQETHERLPQDVLCRHSYIWAYLRFNV